MDQIVVPTVDRESYERRIALLNERITNQAHYIGELQEQVTQLTQAPNEEFVYIGVASECTKALIHELLARDAHGKAKYGTSLDRDDLTLAEWLQHQKEELLDGAGYAEAALRIVKQQEKAK